MKQKSVLITGGSRGIGAATVRALSNSGWKVVFIYRNSHEQAKLLQKETGAAAVCCDLCGEDCDNGDNQHNNIKRCVQRAKDIIGVENFDAVVCNAATSQICLMDDMKSVDWKQMVGLNLSANFFLLQEILPSMISAKSGSIVMVSSMWGQTGASCEAAYSATKAGIIGLTKSIAKEVGPSGIRANCVCPGVIDTEMNRGLTSEERDLLTLEIPMGRIGDPYEVAELIQFLCEDRSSYITGQVIGINGGMVI